MIESRRRTDREAEALGPIAAQPGLLARTVAALGLTQESPAEGDRADQLSKLQLLLEPVMADITKITGLRGEEAAQEIYGQLLTVVEFVRTDGPAVSSNLDAVERLVRSGHGSLFVNR